MKIASAIMILGATFIFASRADAECICQCVDGRMQPLCSRSIDLPPICPPTICPKAAPSIAPINPPTIPPIGLGRPVSAISSVTVNGNRFADEQSLQ